MIPGRPPDEKRHVRGHFAIFRLLSRMGLGDRPRHERGVVVWDGRGDHLNRSESWFTGFFYWVILVLFVWAALRSAFGGGCVSGAVMGIIAVFAFPFAIQSLLILSMPIHALCRRLGFSGQTPAPLLMGRIQIILLTLVSSTCVWFDWPLRIPSQLWLLALLVNATCHVLELPAILLQDDTIRDPEEP
jgi:hypothetical protein